MNTDFVIYLVKVNAAIILFYGFYRLLFRQDTFFTWKRITLLSILVVSFLYPLVHLAGQFIEHQSIDPTLIYSYILPEVRINGEMPVENTSILDYWPVALWAVYFLGIGILLIRMLIQIGGIIYQIIRTQSIEIHGIKIHQSPGLKTPFSFFSWIVLDKNQYTESELIEILSHEETHARQGHSIDTILTELACIFCWFNPFIWLMKQEIRLNLEFLADRSVLQSGCEAEHYQIHLLRLSYHKAAAKLTNNFNVSLLKKRIFMMNKKETSKLSILKYALLVPVFIALVLFNGTQKSQAQTTQSTPPEKTEQKEEIFPHVEEMPRFPGGEKVLMAYLQENIIYPEDAQKQGIQGRVVMRFVVASDGSIKDVEVVRPLFPSCDKEATRIVENMPNWTPGKQDGENVAVYYTLPILFKLDAKDSKKIVSKSLI